MKGEQIGTLASSFRDPSGFVFRRDSILYRQINNIYHEDYDLLMNCGLYEELIKKNLLVPHQEVEISAELPETAYKIIKPLDIPFISYPYEWSFSQLKQAAITTLEIERTALGYGLTLKDASAYNIQFLDANPVLIDTLSFERYNLGDPWIAYLQVCKHFLAPLALMACCDIRMNQLLRVYIDGIPLDLASSLLPKKTWANLGILMHIHLHARSQEKHEKTYTHIDPPKIRMDSLIGLVESLLSTVNHLKWQPEGTEWANYYDEANYTPSGLEQKEKIILEYLEDAKPRTVWDLGANTGVFSRLASKNGIFSIAFDIDPACVEKTYLETIKNHESSPLPLLLDLTNPSPGIGWGNEERTSLIERGPVDMVFALALIHHLAITNNVPLSKIAAFLARICNDLIIEFVPKDDSQVQKMLANREDIFDRYTQDIFEQEFRKHFIILRKDSLIDSLRTLYLMKRC